MTLLEILLLELEGWPEGKEYAYQSATTSDVYFETSEDSYPTIISLCQIASNRGIDHKVTREEWETAKMKALPFFKDVSAIIGEEGAVRELLAVGTISDTAQELDEAFVFADTPQGLEFWKGIMDPTRESDKLKYALSVITAAMKKANPEHCIRLQVDGSGSVRDQDDNEIIYFRNTESLVKKYLNHTPKFDHWALLQDRFKWIAKDRNGDWWAYEDKPSLKAYGWKTNGDCRTLDLLKVEIPCHWTTSLIKRPSTSA